MKKIVIIGVSGFLGSNLAKALSREHHVVGISRSPFLLPGANNFHHLDITLDDQGALLPICQEADFVFHMASDTTPASSAMQPALELNNLIPTIRLLEILQQTRQPTLVYISSGGAVYAPSTNQTDRDENQPLIPTSYYGAGKIAAEAMIHAYTRQTGNRAVIIRPANLYGPDQVVKKQFGIIPTLINCLKTGNTFTLWGDGKTVKDFLYIDDFCALCAQIVRSGVPATTETVVINAGSGQGTSIIQLCTLLQGLSNKTLQIQYAQAKITDNSHTVLDNSRAWQLYQWAPATSLESGLRQTLAWHKLSDTQASD